jgi:hypothetical protein
MKPTNKALSLRELSDQRSKIERRANVIRSRLLRTIDALDNRRHQVQEIGHHAKRLAVPLAATLVGAVVIAAGATFAVRALLERRRERHFSYRLSKAVAPFRAEVKPPFWQDALRKLTLTAVGILASEFTKRGAHAFLDGRTVAFLPVHRDEHAPPVRPTPPLLQE